MNESPDAMLTAMGRYRDRFGWPCTAHGHAVWTMAGQSMDAVDVPVPLAPRLRSILRKRGYPVVVVIVPGAPQIWRFLVAPRANLGHGLCRELVRHRLRYRRRGDLIELPPTRVPGGELRWLRGPGGELPQVTNLIGAVLHDELAITRTDEAQASRQLISRPS